MNHYDPAKSATIILPTDEALEQDQKSLEAYLKYQELYDEKHLIFKEGKQPYRFVLNKLSTGAINHLEDTNPLAIKRKETQAFSIGCAQMHLPTGEIVQNKRLLHAAKNKQELDDAVEQEEIFLEQVKEHVGLNAVHYLGRKVLELSNFPKGRFRHS